VNAEADLPEIVTAAHTAGSFSGCLYGGKQQAHQDTDDGNHN
jgi:hypothetical protein